MFSNLHAKGRGREEADSVISLVGITKPRRLVVFRAVCSPFKFHKNIAFFRDSTQSRCDVNDVAEEGRDLLSGREDGGFAVFRRGSRPSSALAIFQVCKTDVAIFIMLECKHILQKYKWKEWKRRSVRRRSESLKGKAEQKRTFAVVYLFKNIAAFRVSSKPKKHLKKGF